MLTIEISNYIYSNSNYLLYVFPILELDSTLSSKDDIPTNSVCLLVEKGESIGVRTYLKNGFYRKPNCVLVDTILKGYGFMYDPKSDFKIYDGYKKIESYRIGKDITIEKIVPFPKNYDCSFPDTILVTLNKQYDWVKFVSLSVDERNRGAKIIRMDNIFNARYCDEFKDNLPRRHSEASIEEMPIFNLTKIDSIFAKLIPYLPKKK